MKLTQVFSLSPANKSDGFPINPMLIDFSSMGVDLFKNIMLLVHQHTSEMGFHFKIYDRITGLCFLVDITEHLSAYKERLEEEIQVILNRIEGINVSNDHTFVGNVPSLIKSLETTQYMLNKVNREIERINEGIVDIDFPEASPDFRSQDEKEFCDTLAREAGQDAIIQKQYEDPGKEFWDMSARDADDEAALTIARTEFNVIRVHFPTLEDVQKGPILQTSVDNTCPRKLDGICRECQFFKGYYNPEGVIFSYMSFDAFCQK